MSPGESSTSSATAEDAQTLAPIYELLRAESRFSTFIELADAADLAGALSDGGPYTVFAPTNDAFSRAGEDVQGWIDEQNVDQMRDLVLSHVSNGATPMAELGAEPLLSLAGYDLRAENTNEGWRLNGARLIEPDLSASNGMIHVIDDVLLPDTDQGDH